MPLTYTVFFDKKTCKGYVVDKRESSDLENRWYGRREENKLYLDLVEIAYLLLKKRASLVIDGVKIDNLDDFLEKSYECLKDFFWPKLIVYKDLRDRGRRVKVLDEDKFIVKDKYGDLRLVVILEEGRTRDVADILSHLDSSMDNNLKLVYAIVSFQGDLTYYELTKVKLKRD